MKLRNSKRTVLYAHAYAMQLAILINKCLHKAPVNTHETVLFKTGRCVIARCILS